MKLQSITRQVMSNTNETIKGQFVKGHLNGVLLSWDFSTISNIDANNQVETYNEVAKSYVKIKFVSDKVETLLPSIPLKNLEDISNIKLGSTGFNSYLANGPSVFQVYVDLGSIYVDSGDEIHVEIINLSLIHISEPTRPY